MSNNNEPTIANKINVIKFTILVIVIGLFTAIGLTNSKKVNVNVDEDALIAVEEMRQVRSQQSRESIIASLEDNAVEFIDSENLLSDIGYEGTPSTNQIESNSPSKNIKVMCPQYLLPTMPDLPHLPAQEVLVSVTRDQLNFILYQHIKEHQNRTIEVRKRLNESYVKYLETCN